MMLLMRIGAAQAGGQREMLLVGDAPYYGRFGFSAACTGKLAMPGPFEPARLLGLALAPDATEATGLVTHTAAIGEWPQLRSAGKGRLAIG
jgi:predicted N-acetyltransferase YhbS